MTDFKKMAEERRMAVVGNFKCIEAFKTDLMTRINKAWELKESSIDPEEIKQAYETFIGLIREWRKNVIIAEKCLDSAKLEKMEVVAVLIANDSTMADNDELKDLVKLAKKTNGANTHNGKSYNVGQFKSLYDYNTFVGLVLDNFELCEEYINQVFTK